MTKKIVVEKKQELYLYDMFDGTSFDDVEAELAALKQQFTAEQLLNGRVKFSIDFVHDRYGSDSMELNLISYRDETDKEYQKRMEKEAADKKRAKKTADTRRINRIKEEEELRKLYEELKKKFG